MLLDSTQVRTKTGSDAGCVATTPSAVPSTLVPSHTEALMRKPVFVCLLVIVAVLMISGVVQAQSAASATITGRVTDPQGAVVANATVTARNVSTGVEHTSTTTGSGFYTIPNVPPGAYEVRIAAAGFAKGVSKVELQVGDQRDVNFQLTVGATATTVEVSGEAPLIETTKTEVSTSISATDMSRLPVLSGGTGVSNDYAQLALSAPGVHADTTGNTGNGVGGNADLVPPGAFN